MKREFVVGLVFAALIAVLLAVTVWVNDPGFFRRRPPFGLTARFREVAGLKPGDEAWVYGTVAGRVDSIRPDGQGRVEVRVLLDSDPGMRADAEVKIAQRTALGGAIVSIHPGTPQAPPAAQPVYDGRSVSDPFAEISGAVAEIRGPVKETFEEARKVLKDVSARSEAVMRNLDETVANTKALTDDARAGKGTLGKLLADDTLYEDLKSAVASLKRLGDDANGGGGAIDVLLHDKQVAQDLRETVASLRSASADLDQGRGTLGKLLKDPALYDELAAAARDVKAMAEDARAGKGVLGRLIYDEELARRLDSISDDVATITGKIRRGEGTLGKLVNDEVLYADLRRTLAKLGGGVDDARENAPILTFAGFLFAGF